MNLGLVCMLTYIYGIPRVSGGEPFGGIAIIDII